MPVVKLVVVDGHAYYNKDYIALKRFKKHIQAVNKYAHVPPPHHLLSRLKHAERNVERLTNARQSYQMLSRRAKDSLITFIGHTTLRPIRKDLYWVHDQRRQGIHIALEDVGTRNQPHLQMQYRCAIRRLVAPLIRRNIPTDTIQKLLVGKLLVVDQMRLGTDIPELVKKYEDLRRAKHRVLPAAGQRRSFLSAWTSSIQAGGDTRTPTCNESTFVKSTETPTCAIQLYGLHKTRSITNKKKRLAKHN